MRRLAIVLLTVTWLMMGVVFSPGSSAWAASEAAALRSVKLSSSPTGTELILRVDGIYSYKAVQVSPDTLFIDLTGAKPEGVARSQHWVSPAFSGYKLLSYRDASGQPVVRIQVDTRQSYPFDVQRDASRLRLLYGKSLPAAAAAAISVPAESSTRVAAPASTRGPLLVSNVTFDKRGSGETFVDVSTSRSATYRVTTLSHPARLVVDIEGARNASLRRDYSAGTPVVKDVRVAQFRAKDPSIVRVVADLNGNPAFDVHGTPVGLRIELRPRGMAELTHSATQVPVPSAKPAATSPVTVSRVATPPPTTEVIHREAVVVHPLQAGTRDVVRQDVQSTLPASVSSRQVVAAPLPPPASATPEALRAERAARTLTFGRGTSPAMAQGAPPANPSGPAEDAKPVYTGESISLNLKDVDLKDFFRLIHEISGLNIIIDPNVTGTVTLVLDSVPWDQALDIVLRNNGLGKVLEGNVLRIAKLQTLTAEQEEVAKLAAARMDAAPLVTMFRPLNYAKASDINALLKSWVGGAALSRRGTVLVDSRANMLVISDVQSQIPIIENVLSKLDRKAKQVSIEARVVLANTNFTRSLSASLLGGYVNTHTTTSGGTGANSTVTIPPPSGSIPLQPPTITTTSAGANGFGVAAITNAGARYFINAAISAAEERDEAKTISRPTIVTQNNVQGMVQQGVQVPIQTTINNTVSIQYVNATLRLTVTPQVTDDSHIFLIVDVNNASVGAAITGAGPSINTQQATTSVLVPDGGTVVFGGITVTSRSKAATYVPWLGSIPVLGHLFKTSNVQDQDQELLFFVSPKILPT